MPGKNQRSSRPQMGQVQQIIATQNNMNSTVYVQWQDREQALVSN